MKKYTYEISVSAQSEPEAETKIKALSILGSALSAKELEKLAHVVKNDPVKTAMAKQYLGV
jgi:hypothetical protein